MLSSVSGLSRDELERMSRAIGRTVLARRDAGEAGPDSVQPIPPTANPSLSVPTRQAVEFDMEVPDDFVPTQAEIDEINHVVLEGDLPMSVDEDEEEDEDIASEGTLRRYDQ